MLIVFAYTHVQGLIFIQELMDAKPEINNWKVNKDFKICTCDHYRCCIGYKCDVVFLSDWFEKVKGRDYEDINRLLKFVRLTDKTKEYFKEINNYQKLN